MKKVKVMRSKTIEYNRLKNLLIAAYLLGQETGLRGLTYSNPECVNHRENLISFIFSGETQ